MDIVSLRVCSVCKRELPYVTDDGKHNFVPHHFRGSGKIIEICIRCKLQSGRRSIQEVGWGAVTRDFAWCSNPKCVLPPNEERLVESKSVGKCCLVIVRAKTWQKHIYRFHCEHCGDNKETVFESNIPIESELVTFCPFCTRRSDRHRVSEERFEKEAQTVVL